MQKITITFEPDGEYSVDLEGFHGKGCQKELEEIAAGDKVIETHKKPEFFEQAKQTEKARS